MTTPCWLKMLATDLSQFNVPDGPAWACVLKLVQTHIHSFNQEDRALLLGFIEDWARGVSWQCPYPEGAESVAAIAHWLLREFNDYRSNDQLKRTLQIIAKIPETDRDRFAALLQGTSDNERREHMAEEFRKIIFEGFEGMPAARDMPELVISVANKYLLCSEDDLQSEWGYGSQGELDTLFGIKEGTQFNFFPASAYRGPFLSLLRNHPRQGIDFVISVFNHSADWYAHPRVQDIRVEPPFEIALTFADGTSQKQWCNFRLWNLYRGATVGPDALQSILMALEQSLLEIAEAFPHEIDSVLLHILKKSESAALTAVVASVATAFPHASGEALLVLLRTPQCISLDRQRLGNEIQAPSRFSDMFPVLDAMNRIYEEERKESDARPHRHQDIEMAIAQLQWGPFFPRVHEILDWHRSNMPAIEEQNEDDRMWRLALHRMDLRQYTISKDAAGNPVVPEAGTYPEDGRQIIQIKLNIPEPDVKEMVDQNSAKMQTVNAIFNLLMWGLKVFDHEEDTIYDPSQWQQRLNEARNADFQDDSNGEFALFQGGPAIVAAVCIRDHWEEMKDKEQNWCYEIVCSEVEQTANLWNRHARVQRNGMSADRKCAWVIPLLLGKSISDGQRSRVLQTLALALTHAIEEVRWYAASGIGINLWLINRELTLRCVNALSTEATLIQQAVDTQGSQPYEEHRQIDEIDSEAASFVRQQFMEADAISVDAYRSMDPTTWFGAEANTRILAILGQAPTEDMAIMAFERLAHTLVEWWSADDNRRLNRDERRQERNYHTESALSKRLQYFLLRTSMAAAETILQPILEAVNCQPHKIRWLLSGLICAEDLQPNTAQFWSLWELFAEKVRHATWLAGIDSEHSSGTEVISVIFFGISWNEGVRHWRSLEGHAGHVHTLFEDLPATSTVLESYLRFLYHIGEQSLPEAFIRITNRLKQGGVMQMLRNGNTIFMLESLLQRYVYGKPLELKSRRDLREAVLFLLDTLVEQGSSAAFRMRDDFVTPLSVSESA
ncbi:MAG: hypothetical protein ACYDCO_26280 [Armatimonadota bacterium]